MERFFDIEATEVLCGRESWEEILDGWHDVSFPQYCRIRPAHVDTQSKIPVVLDDCYQRRDPLTTLFDWFDDVAGQ